MPKKGEEGCRYLHSYGVRIPYRQHGASKSGQVRDHGKGEDGKKVSICNINERFMNFEEISGLLNAVLIGVDFAHQPHLLGK